MIVLSRRNGEPDYAALIDELVEAHLDTIEIAQDAHDDPSWSSHLSYLQSLVRLAKRVAASSSA
jgi:hypothetical protein